MRELQLSEKDWQRLVVDWAQLNGWRVWHDYDSRRNSPGWPDWVMIRPPELIFAELKTNTGSATLEQRRWLNDLVACGQEAAIWRPRDWPVVQERLRRKR